MNDFCICVDVREDLRVGYYYEGKIVIISWTYEQGYCLISPSLVEVGQVHGGLVRSFPILGGWMVGGGKGEVGGFIKVFIEVFIEVFISNIY